MSGNCDWDDRSDWGSADWDERHNGLKAGVVVVAIIMAVAAALMLGAVVYYLLRVLSHGGGHALPLHLSVEGTVLCCALIAGAIILLVAAVRMPARCLADLMAAERDVEVKQAESRERASSRNLANLMAWAEARGVRGDSHGKPVDDAGGKDEKRDPSARCGQAS